MWLDRIETFQKENKQILDIKFELHLAIYVKEVLKDVVTFSSKDETIATIDEKEYSFDEFFYWWQIDRFDEIISEEEIIFNEFNELKKKIISGIQKVKQPESKETDSEEEKLKCQEKIKENNEKIQKLNDHLKSEAELSNHKINTLKSFRSMYPTCESLRRFIDHTQILIQNKK